MSVRITLELEAKPDSVDQLMTFMKEILPDTLSFPGCEGLEFCRNQDTPENMLFIESWATRGDYEKYLAWRSETGVLGSLGEWLAAPPNARYYDLVEF